MPCTPGVVKVDGDFIFPFHKHGDPYTPVNIPITGCGLACLNPDGGKVQLDIRGWGYPDSDFKWHYDGWWVSQEYTVLYTGRDDTHILGVTRYPSHGKIDNLVEGLTGYYNPNAYWTPPADYPDQPPPPGGDPEATPGQDPETLDPPVTHVYENKPYHYADLKTYDYMGVNRTGLDMDPIYDPDDPETLTGYGDPYDSDVPVVKFVYDDQDPEGSTLANVDWEPDGESVSNQAVRLMTAWKEGARGIRKIARNRNARKEIGVYSNWDSVAGANVRDVSEQNVEAHAISQVQAYGRPPNHFTLHLKKEPATGTPERGSGEDPAIGWQPQPFRDFGIGDRVLVRYRQGYIDTGEIPVRIMHMKVAQADADNNVQVTLDVVPATGDLAEVEVV